MTKTVLSQQNAKNLKLRAEYANNKKAKGDSGQYEFSYQDVTSEFDTNLMGRNAAIEFEKMSKSDSIIGGALSSYYNLLLSCNWTLDEIDKPTAEEQKVADVLKSWFFETNNFETMLLSILKMLPLGFSVFNKFSTPFKFGEQKYMMPVLLERIQKSVYRIDYAKELIEQITSRGLTTEIPFKDLVFFTFRQEGIDRRGVSLIRQAYYDYLDKKDVKAVAKKALVRNLLGLPIGTVPMGTKPDSPEYLDFQILMDTLSNRQITDTDDAVILPENYTLEMFKSEFNINEVKDFIGYYDSSMLVSVLAQFIILGQNGGGGSYSLGADQSDFFTDGLKFIIDYVTAQFTKEVIAPAVKSNWANIDASKFKLVGLNLDKKASEQFAKVLDTLMKSGILKAQSSDEKQIREMYGLKPINEKERKENEPKEPASEKIIPKVEKATKEKASMKPIDIVNFYTTPASRTQYIDQEVKSLTKYSQASLQLIADKLLSSINFQLKKGSSQAQGLKDVQLDAGMVNKYKKNMGKRLSAITLNAWESAKKRSAPHIKALRATNPSDLPSKTLTSFVINQSDLAVEKQVETLRQNSLLVSNTATTKGYSIEQTLAQVEANMDTMIASGNNAELASAVSIPQAMTYGEQAYYKLIEDDLWGYRYQNTAPKTNICKSLVDKVYRVGSIEMGQIAPPNHFRCKSFFEPIYKDEGKPGFDNYIPAPGIMKEKTM